MAKTNSDEGKKGIKSTIILEVIGKPPEHLVSTLENIIKQIDEEKGVKVLAKKINEPTLMKNSKEYYATFAEVDLEVEDIRFLAIVMFKYMPAHVEVLEPELIALTNNGWSDILSELTRRLHGYDEVARMIQIENSKMRQKLKELMPQENSENKVEEKTIEEEKPKSKKKKK